MNGYSNKRILAFAAMMLLLVWPWVFAASCVYGRYSGHETEIWIYLADVLVSMALTGAVTAVVCRGLTREKSGICWKSSSKRSLSSAGLAVLLPCALALGGALLYGALFPHAYEAAWDRMAQLGMGIWMAAMFALSLGLALVYWPFVLGEEIGWTGYIMQALTRYVGKRRAVLLRGLLYGLWHAPLIVANQHARGLLHSPIRYNAGGVGMPYSGVLLALLFAVSLSVVLTWIYERSGSIWVSALAHAMINACAGFVCLLSAGEISGLLGPTNAGLISGIPLYAFALWLWVYRI